MCVYIYIYNAFIYIYFSLQKFLTGSFPASVCKPPVTGGLLFTNEPVIVLIVTGRKR